jgi:hypothetical protein
MRELDIIGIDLYRRKIDRDIKCDYNYNVSYAMLYQQRKNTKTHTPKDLNKI